jgi:glycosyltransferase involved in cell wall biosynthesis
MGVHIGIDASCWLNRRGYGRFARELLTALVREDRENTYTFVADFDPALAEPANRVGRWVRVRTTTPAAQAAAAAGRRSVRDMWAMRRAVKQERFDLFFFPSAYTYFPVSGPMKVIVAVHDVIPERFPQHVFPNWRAAFFWKMKLLAARRRADLVLTVSEASRRDLMEEFRISEVRIRVVPEAADGRFRRLMDERDLQEVEERRQRFGDQFLLYVGGISPHKNLELLLDVLAALRRQPGNSRCRLVLVGEYERDVFHSSYEALRKKSTDLGLNGAVVFTGYVSDSDLVYLYNAAPVFVLPSLLEGFGLPALEAMACGTPVVASAAGSLPEVVGDAGLLCKAEDPEAFREAIARVLCDPELRASLRDRGLKRAAKFSWSESAKLTQSIFQQLARDNR